jgi:DNA invertase Pin-like site-specific DNA recombinase
MEKVGCDKVFTETASGTEVKRPKLKLALKAARPGDVLVVWRFDRLTRSLLQLLETEDKLRRRGVELRSLTEAVDLSTPHGRLMFQIQGAAGEYEWRQLLLRTNAGLVAARARGRAGGRPRSISDAEIAEAMALMESSMKVPEIARRLGISKPTLYRYLPHAKANVAEADTRQLPS